MMYFFNFKIGSNSIKFHMGLRRKVKEPAGGEQGEVLGLFDFII